jgi:hypothetical protein
LGLRFCSSDACSDGAFDLRTMPSGDRAAFRLQGQLDAGATVELTAAGLLVRARSTEKEPFDIVEAERFTLSLFLGKRLYRRLEGEAHYTLAPQYPGPPKRCKWAYFGDLPRDEIWRYETE